MPDKKKLLFSVPRSEFDLKFYAASRGPGGQKVNKTASACRISHKASGAVGDSKSERSQMQNRKLAFRRLIDSKKFQTWLRVESAARMEGFRDVKHKVKKMLGQPNLKVEFRTAEGNWTET